MREIKFRAWDKGEKIMVLLDQRWICTEYSSIAFGSSQEEYHGICEWPKGKEEDQVLMQFTGLKDKNGKEIYEGDIIDNEGARQKYEVVFHKGCFCINRGGFGHHIFNETKVEVIGNIYENPELLK